MMISKEEIGTLIGREGKPGHPVLSVYLDVNQSRETNLNRKFEVSLGNLLRELEQGLVDGFEREEFAADAERMRRFVSNYRPGARSLVIFCDTLEDFLWYRELNVPLRSEARWSETFYLRPLIETLDETVLAATLGIAEEAERNGEIRLVEELISNAARAEQRAVTGLDATLRALRLGRIWRLVYADGFAPSGSRCVNCAMLFEEKPESCAYCGADVRAVDDLVEQAAQRVVVSGGKVEQVRGTVVERLREAGGIGACLKF